MAIQIRRGLAADFNPAKLKPGEFATVQDDRKLYLCIAAGVVKEIQLSENLELIVAQMLATAQEEIEDDILNNNEYEIDGTTYTGLTGALLGILAKAMDETYQLSLVSELPQVGEEKTIYLIEKSNGKFDKWWYVENNEGNMVWDNFGGSSTVVVTSLPQVGEDDIDYILSSNGEYQYYKYINNGWRLIAGSSYEVIEYPSGVTISVSGTGFPSVSASDHSGEFYLRTDKLWVYYSNGSVWSLNNELVSNPSVNKDYYLTGASGNYCHYRYIGNSFEQIGSDAYSRSEIDTLLASIVSTIESEIDTIDAKVDSLGNLVADVAENSNGITIYYKDGTSKNINTKDTSVKVEDLDALDQNKGVLVTYTDGSTKEIEIAGGGGGGGTSGNAMITRVTDASTQMVFGESCNIQYRFSATDSSGDPVGDGVATWYVNSIRRATSTARQGVVNSFDVSEFLSVGTNTIRISVSVDTGGENPTVTTKSWTVNAINLYLIWDYDDTTLNSADTVAIRWTPYGDLSKTTHFIIDGVERTDLQTTTTRSGVQQFVVMNKLSHGSHMVQLYMTATVNGTSITSASVYHDMIFVDSESNVPIIGCSLSQHEITQYNTLRIPLVIYNPASLTANATLAENGTTVATWQNVDRSVHYWNYTPITDGVKTLTITCGETVKTLTITVNELDIDNEEVTGYSFRLKASDLAGNEALRAWSSNGVTAAFSNNFDWNNGGIQVEKDEDGNIRQFICIKSGTRMTINHKLFADDATANGKTFKIIFKVENCREYDASIASCYAENIGIRMYAHESIFSSTGTSLNVPYGEGEYVELEFDVYPSPTPTNGSFRYMMAWMDGVISTNRVYGSTDNFTQTVANQTDITIGSDDCDVYIYMVKAYPNYMSRENHIVNFISDAPNAQEMVKRYDRNDILDSSGTRIDYQKVVTQNPDLRVWLYDIPYMTISKDDKVKNCQFEQFWQNGDQYYRLSGTGVIKIQGTSSVDYLRGAANTDIEFKTLTDGNGNDLLANAVSDETYGKNLYVGENDAVTIFIRDGEELTPECIPIERDANGNVTKYIKALGMKINDDSTPITYSNTKVNFASCEQVNNYCNAIWYQMFQPYQSKTKRDCMEFSMGVQFIKDSGNVPDADHFVLWGDENYHLYSIANMGTSKKNVHIFHDLSNPNECCIEIGNNLDDLCRMVDDDLSNLKWFGGSSKACECRYPDTDHPSQNIINGWQRFVTWMCNSNPNAATDDPLPSPETYGIYTFRGHSRSGTQVLRGTTVTAYAGTYTHDTFNRRMAKMLSECEDYLVMDSVVYHFCYIERHTMCDNVAKNTFWSSDDLLHWDLSKAYDMDTSDGNNNEGQLVFDYGNEANDYIGTKSVFNANDAVWFVFISNLVEACHTMFINRESAGAWSATAYHNFLLKEQQKVPERIWNECYWYDYLRTYEQGINDSWMTFLDGGQKTHQRWHYEYFEEIYDSSKYRGSSCTSQNVNFRGYYPSRWEGLTDGQWEALKPVAQIALKMYNKCYINISIDGTIYSQKAERGTTYTIDFSQQSKLNDTVINIYSAQMIQEIGDISRLYPGTPNFANAIRLRSLHIGSSTEGYKNSNLTGITFGNNRMLEYLYVQQLAFVTSGLDLSNCVSLIYLDASGSSFTGYDFAKGGLLTTAYIESPTSLSMIDLYYLTDSNFHVTSFDYLSTLRLENCDGIDSLDIIDSADALTRLRVTGIDWEVPTTELLNRLLLIMGISETGGNLPQSVLTGDVFVSGSIRNQEILEYEEAWPNLTVSYDPSSLITQHLVTYVNADSEHTVLFRRYVDQGSKAPDPVLEGWIETPTLEQTQQYTFAFSGWDSLPTITSPRTVTATYTQTVRTYRVRWYSRPGLLWEEQNNVEFGAEVNPVKGFPTNTSDEEQFIYHICTGWNKSTGFVRGDIDVYATWDDWSGEPEEGSEMNEMTVAEIYAVCQMGLQDDYWEELDYVPIKLGHDFNFSNVDDCEIGSDVVLTGVKRTFFNDDYSYYFDGETAYTTDIQLFAEDSPAFTIAIDFQFHRQCASNGTIISCHEGNTAEGFRLYYNGNNAILQWGDTTVNVGYRNMRDIVVFRHPQGSRRLYVYYSFNGTSDLADNVQTTVLYRSTETQTDEPLTFGAVNNSGVLRNYARGTIHWCKIWYDDIGANNATWLAEWIHEVVRMEYWGKNKYWYANSQETCKASWFCNSQIGGINCKGLWHNNVNDNTIGWEGSIVRAWLNSKFIRSLPFAWQAVVKEVEINATVGGMSSAIKTSYDKAYLISFREVGSGTTQAGYIEEVGTSTNPVPWFTNNQQRVKFMGITRKYAEDITVYTCGTEPTLLYEKKVNQFDLWANTSNSSICYIFLSKEILDQFDIDVYQYADTEYMPEGGGWVSAAYWWERSPSLSYSTYFVNVNTNGYPGGSGNATSRNRLVPGLSI